MVDFNSRILAQVAPSGTSATTGYSPPSNSSALVQSIIVANVTGSAATYSIFVDQSGSTTTDAKALFKAVSLAANTTSILDVEIPLVADASTLSVQSGTGAAITYTIIGEERRR